MKKVYVSKNYSDKYTASSKAKMDVEKIAKQNGYANIGLPQTSISNKYGRIITYLSSLLALIRMPSNGIVLCQYPSYGIEKFISSAKRRNNNVVTIIHDINYLRNLAQDSLTPLFNSDILIVHNEKMNEWLYDKGITKDIRTLHIFDYIADEEIDTPTYPLDNVFNICFAGNLEKSLFLNELTTQSNRIKLFGIGSDKLTLRDNVEYIGTFSPNELRKNLNSHFGLVWDGSSCSTCDGVNGEYLKYIAPHKLSMYLSTNIPVIVWDKSAMADFVLENRIGLIISNLNDLDSIMKEISQPRYNDMVKNVKKIGEKIRNGEYLGSILANI